VFDTARRGKKGPTFGRRIVDIITPMSGRQATPKKKNFGFKWGWGQQEKLIFVDQEEKKIVV